MLSLPRLVLEPLAPGYAGIKQTTFRMAERVWAALTDPHARVRRAAEWIVRGTPGGDMLREAHAIWRFTRTFTRFTRDPSFLEFVQDPLILLERIDRYGWAAGDCDDSSTLTESLGHSIRLPLESVISFYGGEPKHVHPAMRVGPTSAAWLDGDDRAPSGLLALDAADPRAVFGRHPPAQRRRIEPALPA